MRLPPWLLLSIICLVLPSMGWAATRYAAPTGSGATCSSGTPCSLATCVAATVAGDTCFLKGGTYTSGINSASQTVNSGTSWTNAVTIASAPGETAILQPGGGSTILNIVTSLQYLIFDRLTVDGSTTNFSAMTVAGGAHHIRFQNGEVRNTHGSGISGADASGSDVQILHNNIHHNGADAFLDHGVYLGYPNVLIEGNDIHHNIAYGIQLYACVSCGTFSTTGSVIRNNIVHDNRTGGLAGGGIFVAHAFGGMQIYNNVVYNHLGGIDLGNGDNGVKVWNNTIHNVPSGFFVLNIPSGSSNTEVKNNIFSQYVIGPQDEGSGTSFGTNLCTGTGTGCGLTNTSPDFASSAGGDFHIATAGSAANNAGVNLSSAFTTDAEGAARPATGNWTIGAYEFASVPFTPLGTIAKYAFEEGSLTSAADSSGQGNTCTLTSAAWGTGIIGTFSFAPTGTQSCTAIMPTGIRPTTQAGLSVWINATTTPAEGSILAALPGDALAIYVYPPPDGRPLCQVYDGTTFYEATGSASVLTGTNRHISCSFKSGDGVRLRVDDAQVAFAAVTASLNYSLGGNFAVGRSSASNAYRVIGRVDQVYAFDTEITAAMNTSLYNELVPPVGMSVAHTAWYAANTAPGTQLGTTDAPRSHLLTTPLGLRYALRKSDPGSLTEYFRMMCIVNTGAGFPPWTSALELSNSFGSLGIRYLADSAITQGQSIAALLPLDGFTAVNGKVLENPIDTTSPYDASQRITIAQGQHAEEEIRVEFGSPLVAGHQIQCRPVRENGVDFGAANYANIQTLTLTAVLPPSSVQVGTTTQGGTRQ